MPEMTRAASRAIADTAGPGFNNGYEWIREQMLEDRIAAAEIATVIVVVPGIWCDMGRRCARGPGGHWWRDDCRTPG